MRRASRVGGLLIGLAGLGFVTRQLVGEWDHVVASVADVKPWALVAAFFIGTSSMVAIGLLWRVCLHHLGFDSSARGSLRAYFVGQLGKYVPGGIWPVVGRAELARSRGVPGAIAYGSTVLSMGLTYLASALTALGAFLGGERGEASLIWLAPLAVLALGVVLLHPSLVRRTLDLARRVSSRSLDVPVLPWGTSIRLLSAHIVPWIGIASATLLVAVGLDVSSPDLFDLLFATALSWLIGFLAVGAPGGLGVREATFIATASSALGGPGVAAAVALAARVVFILVDVGGAGLMVLWTRRERLGNRSSLSERSL